MDLFRFRSVENYRHFAVIIYFFPVQKNNSSFEKNLHAYNSRAGPDEGRLGVAEGMNGTVFTDDAFSGSTARKHFTIVHAGRRVAASRYGNRHTMDTMETPDGMRQFITYHRNMLIIMIGVCFVIAAVLALAMGSDYSWSAGFAAGAAAQLFKFGFLDIAAIRKIAESKESAPTTQLKSSFLSLVVFGLGLAAVFTLNLNVWAFAAGIFIPRIILIADTYVRPDPFAAGAPKAEQETSDA